MRGVLLMLIVLGVVAGCRHLPPELKPGKEKEALVKPPPGDRRYDYPGLPKEAFNEKYDPRKGIDIAGPGQGMPKGPGMMPVGGGPGGGPGY